MGITESRLDRLIAGYSLLGLALPGRRDRRSVHARGPLPKVPKRLRRPERYTRFRTRVHRAEIVSFDDLMECGSMAAARERDLSAPKARARHAGRRCDSLPLQRVIGHCRQSVSSRRVVSRGNVSREHRGIREFQTGQYSGVKIRRESVGTDCGVFTEFS